VFVYMIEGKTEWATLIKTTGFCFFSLVEKWETTGLLQEKSDSLFYL
jgi:hypothetical protein